MSHYLCSFADIGPKGKEVCIRLGDRDEYIMLFRQGEGVRAYLNVCPHHGRPLNWAPDEFLLGAHNSVICSHHGARFDLDNGQCISGPCRGARLRAVRIRIEADGIWMEEQNAADPQVASAPTTG